MKKALIIILLIALMCCMCNKKERLEHFNGVVKEGEKYGNYGVEVRYSNIGGRGVFATKDYKKGDIIEICPMIYDKCNTIVVGLLKDYLFKVDNQNCGVAFGYGSLYNHSDNYKALWEPQPENNIIIIRAVKSIAKNEEITVSYGDSYWTSRSNKVK